MTSKRVKKSQHIRKPKKLQPIRPVPEDTLYKMCEDFVGDHDSLALDDSFDRRTMTTDLYNFVTELRNRFIDESMTLLDEERHRYLEEEHDEFQK